METRALVSVIIPTYNGSRFIVQAVDSVLAQTYQPIELIVVDDGSTDNTASVLAPYRSRIHYVYQSNQGLSTARNRGIRASTGEYVAFLDSDDVWLPDKISQQVKCLAVNLGIGLVHTDVFYWDQVTGSRAQRNNGRMEYVGNCYARLFSANRITVSSVLVRRECLRHVGGFDDQIRRPSTQDYDLWIRLARYYSFAFIHQPLILYRLHTTNASQNQLMMREDELYVVEKALGSDHSLSKLVGPCRVRKRLFDLLSSIGCCYYYDQENYSAANGLFFRAVFTKPSSIRSWALLGVTFLPDPTVRYLRRLKRLLSPHPLFWS